MATSLTTKRAQNDAPLRSRTTLQRLRFLSALVKIPEIPMHGSYKTPGGKLVAVDFEIDSGRLNQVVLHGDFFLYPEEAITTITEALEGMPAGLIESEIAARVRAAIPPGTEMLGFSPEAIGIAVQRALGEETDTPNG
jgi:hypothetical protein